MKSEIVDMIFADPPYFLSNDGITCQSGKMEPASKKNTSLTESGLSYVRRY